MRLGFDLKRLTIFLSFFTLLCSASCFSHRENNSRSPGYFLWYPYKKSVRWKYTRDILELALVLTAKKGDSRYLEIKTDYAHVSVKRILHEVSEHRRDMMILTRDERLLNRVGIDYNVVFYDRQEVFESYRAVLTKKDKLERFEKLEKLEQLKVLRGCVPADRYEFSQLLSKDFNMVKHLDIDTMGERFRLLNRGACDYVIRSAAYTDWLRSVKYRHEEVFTVETYWIYDPRRYFILLHKEALDLKTRLVKGIELIYEADRDRPIFDKYYQRFDKIRQQKMADPSFNLMFLDEQ